MKDIQDLARTYADGKGLKAIDTLVAEAYTDGYRNGYRDGKTEAPVDLQEGKIEFVDLGLPSGTLWASDYERDDKGSLIFLPYGKALAYSIPTEEQFNELIKKCGSEVKNGTISLIGPNGNYIKIDVFNFKKVNEAAVKSNYGYFWIKQGESAKNCASITIINTNRFEGEATSLFTGYKTPILLVRSK